MRRGARSLLGPSYVRILLALREKPPRFNALKQATGLNASTLNRILEALVRDPFVGARTLPLEGRRIPPEGPAPALVEALVPSSRKTVRARSHAQPGREPLFDSSRP